MSGQPKQGLDWVGWDTRLLEDDERIDTLVDSQGWTGFSIYFYLCQKGYATSGYFYRWDYANSATTARKMGGGIKSDTVKQVVSLCLRNGLFDKRLFDREGILTNKNMQERYMIAVEKRSERGRTVNPKYWLLDSDETKPYIVIPENNHSLSENTQNLPENTTKKSKAKESKVKNTYLSAGADGDACAKDECDKIDYRSIVDLFNTVCVSLPKVKQLTDNRRKQIRNAYQQLNGDFKDFFESVEQSDFLTGRSGNWNGCSFDWILKPSNLIKIIEGNYANKAQSQSFQSKYCATYDISEYESTSVISDYFDE